jgi:ABC-2 type transport system ATP-binding protein
MVAASVVVDKLVVRYGAVEAVRGASFTVPSGEVFGLLGPNGAGKTSVVRVLVGLRPPHAGKASILGRDVVEESRRVRASIGYVPQAISADGSLTGRENAVLFAKLYGVPRAQRRIRVGEVLDLMGLASAGDRLVQAYSGGMVRRLEIACALVGNPPLLVLDEPTLGLDPGARRTVWEHLHRRRVEHGMTVLVTTHAMDEAQQHCDRVAVMGGGRLLTEGTPEELRGALGPDATLEDAFVALTGTGTGKGPDEGSGGLRDVRRARRAARRLG